MPEKAFEKLRKSILPQWRCCFFGALIVGFIAHFYKLTNWLPNWDSLVFRYDAQNMLSLGRWFLAVVCAPSSFYDLPFFNGLLCILFHALGAVCICKMFNVQKNVTAFLIGAVAVSFPTVTSVLMYNYVADGYGIAFLFACIAALLLTREKPKYILSACFITLSVGIYQAYITVTIMLVVLYLFDLLIFQKKELGCLIKRAAGCLAGGFCGMLLYYGVLKIILLISGTSLLSYQGIDTAASFDLNLFASLYTIKETLLSWLFDFSNGFSLFVVLNTVIFLITAFFYLKQAIANGVFTSPLKIIILLVLLFFLSIGGNVLAFLNSEIDYHNLMLMGYFVFYLFFILLYEKGDGAIKSWTVLVVTLTLIFNQVLIANVSYHKAHIAYEKSYGILIRIADRIERIPDSDKYNKILVVGALENSEAYSVNLPPDMTGITDGYIIRADDEGVGQSVLTSALNDYCGKEYTFLSGEDKNSFLEKEELKNMNEWPLENSIAVIDNVIVINLSKEGEKK